MSPPGTRDDRWCFACGADNPIGLHLDFELDASGSLAARFTPRREHQSYAERMHGGLVALVLDEVMVRLLHLLDLRAFTSELTVRLHRPTPVGQEVVWRGWVAADRGRVVDTRAEARLASSGELLASATARCMRVQA
ncbi:MAG TPA: PaaI family thioesterase [Candidatus Saccharimonadales bacterium]|nr:PaaI family thioesterase [Candidatus Saccharimonadales bacterium]